MIDLQKTIHELEPVVKRVGKYQLSKFRSKDLLKNNKGLSSNLVTEVDLTSEQELKKYLRNTFPEHCILAEESGASEVEADYQWVIDPLDGTNNFAHGLPYFCISVGLTYQGQTILGIIYAPYLDEMFTVVKGEGVYFNGEKLQVSSCQILSEAVVVSGFPYDRKSELNNVRQASNIIPEVRGFRRTGAAALDLAYVAAGHFDAYWEFKIETWDICAGSLMVQEAGGVVTEVDNCSCLSIVAGNQQIVNLLKPLLDCSK